MIILRQKNYKINSFTAIASAEVKAGENVNPYSTGD